MTLFDFRVIAHLISPERRVECHDRRLKHAHALFEEHRAVMDPPNCDLAQSLLDHCGDLKGGLEARCLLTRIKQARLYCAEVDKTLQKIQAIVVMYLQP